MTLPAAQTFNTVQMLDTVNTYSFTQATRSYYWDAVAPTLYTPNSIHEEITIVGASPEGAFLFEFVVQWKTIASATHVMEVAVCDESFQAFSLLRPVLDVLAAETDSSELDDVTTVDGFIELLVHVGMTDATKTVGPHYATPVKGIWVTPSPARVRSHYGS